MVKGKDGFISWRKVWGTLAIIFGCGLEGVAQIQGVDAWMDLAPGGVCIVAGLFLWGLVTAQNIKDIARK